MNYTLTFYYFLFSLTLQPIVNNIKTELNSWYLDDGTLADHPDVVLNDFINLINSSLEIGLVVNASKCELFFCSGEIDEEILQKFEKVAPGINVVSKENFELLGSPIFDEGFQVTASKILSKMDTMFKRLPSLNAHVSMFLLRNCFAIPKITSFIRSSPAWKFKNFLEQTDLLIKSTLEIILNVQLEDLQWTQATLPINNGGLGIRRLKDISLPAFLSSTSGVSDLVSELIPSSDKINIIHMYDALEEWNHLNNTTPSICHLQKNWDTINMKRIIDNELPFTRNIDIARFKALQCRESNSWLKAIPSPNVGTSLDNNTLRICVGLRLGTPLCRPHICVCGTQVTKYGIHGLCCQKSAGRYPRHTELNKIISQSLSTINIPSLLEPPGMCRDDGKKPDGVTLIQWSKGRCLVWESTCIDTFADSYISRTSKKARSVVEHADARKHLKYSNIKSNNYHFQTFAIETMGPLSTDALNFANKIGSGLITASGDNRSKEHFFQRISLAVQRTNAASVIKTLPTSSPLDEVFHL